MEKSDGSLYIKTENGIGSITFFHPLSNSLPSNLLERIAKAFTELGTDENVKVILFQSEGEKAFCAGAALNELVAIETKEEGEAFFSGFANVINAMRKCGKLVVGRIQGKTVGGGVGLAGACDYVFATEASSVKLSEISIGIGPFVIEPTLSRKMGVAATSQLSIDATHWQNAYWAKDKGLFSQVFDNIKDMDKALLELLEKLASYNADSMKALKESFWQGTEHWNSLLIERAKLSGTLVLSKETQKALEKFKK